jgi:hypothetical protein
MAGPLRKLVLRRVPFVIWYAAEADEVWLLRLFHARQKAVIRRGRGKRR